MKRPTKSVEKRRGTQRSPRGALLVERVGFRIGRARADLEMTQADLAERIGVNTETVSRFERGVYTPSLPMLEEIAGALGLSVAELVSDGIKPELDADSRAVVAILQKLPDRERTFLLRLLKLFGEFFGRSR